MSPWMILVVGIVLGMALSALLRQKSVQQPDLHGDTPYSRPTLTAPVAPAPEVSPQLERLNQMQLAGTITQTEYNVLRDRLVDQGPGSADTPSTLTITAGTKNKISDIKAIREATHLGLKDAKDVADRIPQVIARDLPRSEVVRMQQILERAGLQVRIS